MIMCIHHSVDMSKLKNPSIRFSSRKWEPEARWLGRTADFLPFHPRQFIQRLVDSLIFGFFHCSGAAAQLQHQQQHLLQICRASGHQVWGGEKISRLECWPSQLLSCDKAAAIGSVICYWAVPSIYLSLPRPSFEAHCSNVMITVSY